MNKIKVLLASDWIVILDIFIYIVTSVTYFTVRKPYLQYYINFNLFIHKKG